MLFIQWRHVAENDVKLYERLLIQWQHVGRKDVKLYKTLFLSSGGM